VQSLGWRLVAASGDIDVRALKDSINLLAKLNITANAERITLTAKTELVIQGGGSATTYNAAGITHVTTGPYTAHAVNFAYTSATNLSGVFPESPKAGEGGLQLFNQYAGLQGIQGGAFEVVDAQGKRLTGALDSQGFATVAGAAPGPARVVFDKDPADTWTQGSVIAKPDWPRTPPGPAELPAPLLSQATELLPSKDWDPAQFVKLALQGESPGLPALASAAAPAASALLARMINSESLPSLPAAEAPEALLEVPGLMAGEGLS
jgi:type VI secretion system secreted protein VgrG